MAAYSSVFKRVEKKYRIGAAERAAVEAAAGGPMAVDAYGRTRITSLYLDTPERSMIARSVEKPLYKEKLRLRAYGDAAGVALMGAFGAGPIVREPGGLPLSDGEVETRVAAGLQVPGAAAALPVFFGIKKKFKGIVYKRRLALTLPAALAFVSGLPYEQACARWPLSDAALAAAALSPVTRQIARELEVAIIVGCPWCRPWVSPAIVWPGLTDPRCFRSGRATSCSIASCASPSTTAWSISTVIASVRHGGPSSSRASPSWR